MLIFLCFHRTLKNSYLGPSLDEARDNVQLLLGNMAAVPPNTMETCVALEVTIRSDVDMDVTPDGVVPGGVASNAVTGVDGSVTVDRPIIPPECVSGGCGVLSAAHCGGSLLQMPLIKQGVKRRHGSIPIAFRAQMGQVFKEENRKLVVNRSKRRIRSTGS